MILREDGEVKTEEEYDEEPKQSSGEENEEVEYPVTGDLLVARKAVNVKVKEDEEVQCDNIFQTRCHIESKVCSVIIDGGSCANVASAELVEN